MLKFEFYIIFTYLEHFPFKPLKSMKTVFCSQAAQETGGRPDLVHVVHKTPA